MDSEDRRVEECFAQLSKELPLPKFGSIESENQKSNTK